MPKLQPTAAAVAMALMCNGVEGSPDVILIDKIPISPHFLRSEFAANLEQGTASVQFRLNEYPGDRYASDTYISKAIPGLNYDPVSHEIRYKDVACAKVTEHTFLVTHWHFVDETGLCAFVEKEVTVTRAGGDSDSYALTEIYLDVRGGLN
ncbi:MAG: hypothetical protein ACHBMF_05705 [Chromatiales bacterium]